jgi:pimeloyl-ACP methyl ester carboxylesterase
MPTLTTKHDGVNIYYEEYGNKHNGTTTAATETIVFSHGMLMNLHMFDAQIEALKDSYHIVAFNHRGHGKSEWVQRPYTMDDLVADAVEVIENTTSSQGGKHKPVHFMGMSTGGYVATRLVLKYPHLLKSVVLIDTDGEAPNLYESIKFTVMRYALLLFGPFGLLVDEALRMLMGAPYRTDPSQAQKVAKWKEYCVGLNNKALYYFASAVFSRQSIIEELKGNDDTPCLVAVGELDVSCPIPKSQALHQAFLQSTLRVIPNAGHTSPIEEPKAVNDAILEFLTSFKEN